jgi:hypothetical protein
MQKRFLWVVLSALLFWSGGVFARTGVALIHGKGGASLANASTAWDYWTSPMISAVTKGYSVPYLVCHYDGTQYMWVAANQVADQLYDFINAQGITDLVLDTHSFGGTVTRWIFSNPNYYWKYAKIISVTRWVNTIAGPHKGSEAADLAGTLSGSWLTGWLVDLVGENTDSTKNCRTSWMAYYNQYYLYGTAGRPALPKPFYTISGWGLFNDWAHAEDFGLAALSAAAGLPGEDDGMVAQYSAEAIGTLWFRTEANHHHNRRNDFKPIGTYLSYDF